MRCVRVVIGESDGFPLNESKSCVMSRRVRLLRGDESFSKVFSVRMGDVCSIGGSLCSDFFPAGITKEVTFAERRVVHYVSLLV